MSPSNSSSHGRLVVDRWSIHQDHLDADNFLAISIMVQRFWDNERGQWLKENSVETTLTSQHQFAKGRVQFDLTAPTCSSSRSPNICCAGVATPATGDSAIER